MRLTSPFSQQCDEIFSEGAFLVLLILVFLVQDNDNLNNLSTLEIKPCRLVSRIRDMEAEWRLKVLTDLIS